MSPLWTVVVIVMMTWKMTSAGDQSCEIHPAFKTKESSAEFLAKSSWLGDGSLLSVDESLFVRRRQCPMRVRVEEEGSKETSLGNGSHSKEVKKAGNSHRKLKGSKRKRKKEKRKRFRKRKKKKSSKMAKRKR